MIGVLLWWYLVAYDPANPWAGGRTLGEFVRLEGRGGCEEQRQLYVVRNPYGFARCEGSDQRQYVSPRETLDHERLQAEIEQRRLEAEILHGQLRKGAR